MTSRPTHRERPALRPVLADPATQLVGTFVLIPRVEIMEALAHAGFEALVIDLEHGPFATSDLPHLVAAGQGAGAQVLARVADLSPATLAGVLDTGVDGIIVPHVSSAADARRAVDAGRYPPQGTRSLNPYVRAAAYQGGGGFTERANESVAVLVMVEGAEALAALDEICAVAGVDAVFVGPVDLSASLGVPGQPGHPVVVEQIERILSRTADLGTAAGVYCPDPAAAVHWRKHGARLCVLSADVAMAFDGFRRYLQGVDDEAGESLP